MSAIFRTHEEMLSEADQLLQDDVHAAEDRVTIAQFYNGIDTMSDDEAEQKGQRNITNHLLGYDSLSSAARQIESIYSRSKHMFTFQMTKMPNGSEHLKQKWEAHLKECLGDIITSSKRFKPEWKTLSGQITLFGDDCLVFRDPYDWCPISARPLVPRGVDCDVASLTHMAFTDFMTLSDLIDAKTSHDKRVEMGFESPWNGESLKTIIDMLKGNLQKATAGNLIGTNSTVEEESEELSLKSASSSINRNGIPVYRIFHKSEDGDTAFDMTILPRLTPSQKKAVSESTSRMPNWIFDKERYFERPEHLLQAFFIDCEIGGRNKWHKVMGLGRLNYTSDVEIEEFFNQATQGALENIKRMYAVKNTADWELMRAWASGNGPSNVLPPGVEVADVSRQPNFQHAMMPMQMLMGITRKNAAASQSNGTLGGAGGPGEELQVQALERQSRNAEALAARMNDIYGCIDELGAEIFRRFLSEDIMEFDPGYAEVKRFQRKLREYGIPINWLAKQIDGRFEHVKVLCSRAAGDGNSVKRQMANAAMLNMLHLFSPQAQQEILRRTVADNTDDHMFAESVVPQQPRMDVNQMVVANQENDIMNSSGIIDFVPQLNDSDLHPVHLEHHLLSMESDVARGKVRPWDQVDLMAFMSKGKHCGLHLAELEKNPKGKQIHKRYLDKLQQVAKAGQEHANNLQQQQEKQNIDPVEQKKLELAERKQELADRQQGALENHREKSLLLAARKASVAETSTFENNAILAKRTAHDMNMKEEQLILAAEKQKADQQQYDQPDPEADGPAPQ